MNVGAQLGTPYPRYVPQVGSYAMPGYAVPGYMMTSQPMTQVEDQVFVFQLQSVTQNIYQAALFTVHADGSTIPSL